MTKRRFVFNPYLYRVCNQETWERLGQMDGLEVVVDGPPFEINAYDIMLLSTDEWQSTVGVLANRVSHTFPDGAQLSVLVFNSELQPLDLNHEVEPTSERK